MKEKILERYKIIVLGLIVSILYWFVDSLIDVIFFYTNEDFIILSFTPSPFELYFKMTGIFFILFFSIISNYLFHAEKTVHKSIMIKDAKIVEERNKLQTVMDTIQNGLSVQDTDYNILYHNHVAYDLFGDCVGKKCYKEYKGNDEICDNCPVELAFKDGNTHSVIRQIQLPNSEEYSYWENVANPIRNSKGKIVSCLEIATNITNRMDFERKLKESEEKYRLITDNANDMITILDEDFKYEYINDRAHLKALGFSKDDYIGKSSLKFVHPDDFERSVKLLKQGWDNGEGADEVRIRHKNGEYRWLEIRGKLLIDGKGKKKALLI